MHDIAIVSPQGRLDSNNSEAFEQSLLGRIDAGETRVVIDLSALDYISSAGMRVLLMAAKRIKAQQGAMALCGLQAHIREVFEISGFLPILTIVPDLQAAQAAVAGA